MTAMKTHEQDDDFLIGAPHLAMSLAQIAHAYPAPHGELLVAIRNARKLSIEQVALASGMTQEKLRRVESGDEDLPGHFLPRVAKALRVDMRTLMEALGLVQAGAAAE